MSTPIESVINAAALAAQAALKAAANAKWIVDADVSVAAARDRGLFRVKLPVIAPASVSDLTIYYSGLGYGVMSNQFPLGLFGGSFGDSFDSINIPIPIDISNGVHFAEITIMWST